LLSLQACGIAPIDSKGFESPKFITNIHATEEEDKNYYDYLLSSGTMVFFSHLWDRRRR
jgi:hypothetical protein